ncbi:MAG: hypothetical protein WCP67_09280 [Verrucomicrobiota bacterium]
MGAYYSMLYLEEENRGIYRIPYRSIVPKVAQCTNLFVPVCGRQSHRHDLHPDGGHLDGPRLVNWRGGVDGR